jgi:hypothetical protein
MWENHRMYGDLSDYTDRGNFKSVDTLFRSEFCDGAVQRNAHSTSVRQRAVLSGRYVLDCQSQFSLVCSGLSRNHTDNSLFVSLLFCRTVFRFLQNSVKPPWPRIYPTRDWLYTLKKSANRNFSKTGLTHTLRNTKWGGKNTCCKKLKKDSLVPLTAVRLWWGNWKVAFQYWRGLRQTCWCLFTHCSY